VTLAARLGVVEGTEPVWRNVLDLLEELLVSQAPVGIGKSVALIVESGDGLW
jgi:hypothetical protein